MGFADRFRPWVLIGSTLAVTGCSLALGDDVCREVVSSEHPINQRTEGAQDLLGPRSLAPLTSGPALLAFAASDDLGDELRVVRVGLDGARLATTCEDDRERTVFPPDGAAPTERIAGISLSAPGADEGLVGVVWSTIAGAVEGGAVRIAAVDPRTGCEETASVGVEIGARVAGVTIGMPAVVRTGADELTVFWADGRSPRPFARAVQLLPASAPRFLPLVADGTLVSDAPIALAAFEGIPVRLAAAALPGGRIALAAMVLNGLTWQAQLAIVESTGEIRVASIVVSTGVGELAAGSSIDVAFDGRQILVAWSLTSAGEGYASLRGRLLTSEGDYLRSSLSPEGEPFVLTTTPGEALAASIVPRDEGGFLLSFTRRALDGTSESRTLQLLGLDADGERQFFAPVCERAELEISRPGVTPTFSSTAILADGNLLVAWTAIEPGGVDADASGIAARVFPRDALLP